METGKYFKINDTGPGLANEADPRGLSPLHGGEHGQWQIEQGREANHSIARWDEAVGDRITVLTGRPDFPPPAIRMLYVQGLRTRQRQRLVEQPVHFRPPERRHRNAADELKRLI